MSDHKVVDVVVSKMQKLLKDDIGHYWRASTIWNDTQAQKPRERTPLTVFIPEATMRQQHYWWVLRDRVDFHLSEENFLQYGLLTAFAKLIDACDFAKAWRLLVQTSKQLCHYELALMYNYLSFSMRKMLPYRTMYAHDLISISTVGLVHIVSRGYLECEVDVIDDHLITNLVHEVGYQLTVLPLLKCFDNGTLQARVLLPWLGDDLTSAVREYLNPPMSDFLGAMDDCAPKDFSKRVDLFRDLDKNMCYPKNISSFPNISSEDWARYSAHRQRYRNMLHMPSTKQAFIMKPSVDFKIELIKQRTMAFLPLPANPVIIEDIDDLDEMPALLSVLFTDEVAAIHYTFEDALVGGEILQIATQVNGPGAGRRHVVGAGQIARNAAEDAIHAMLLTHLPIGVVHDFESDFDSDLD